MAALRCIVVTPETTIRDGPAEFVVVTLDDGELGIAPRHTPLIGKLGYGELRIVGEERLERYYVEGGFVELAGETVAVLASRAVPAEALDEAAVLEQLAAARARPAHTPLLMAARDRAIMLSRAQLRVARRSRPQH